LSTTLITTITNKSKSN